MSSKKDKKKSSKKPSVDSFTKRQETLKKYVVSHHHFKRENGILLRKLKYVVEAMKKFNTRRARGNKEQTVIIKYGNKKLILTRELANKLYLHILHQLQENEKFFKNTMYAAMKKWISVEGDVATVEFVEKRNKKTGELIKKDNKVVMVPVKMGSNKGKALVMLSDIGVAWFKTMREWLVEHGEKDLDSEKGVKGDTKEISSDVEKVKKQRIEAVQKIIETLKNIGGKKDHRVLTSAFVSNASAFFLNNFSEHESAKIDDDDREIINENKLGTAKPISKNNSSAGGHIPPLIMRYSMRQEWFNSVIDALNNNKGDIDQFKKRVQGLKNNHYVFSSSFHLPPILKKRNSVKTSEKNDKIKDDAKLTQKSLKTYRAKGSNEKDGRDVIRSTSQVVEVIRRHKNFMSKIRRERKNNSE